MSKAKISKTSTEVAPTKDPVIEATAGSTSKDTSADVSANPTPAKVTKATSASSKKRTTKPSATKTTPEVTPTPEATVESTACQETPKAVKVKKPKLIRDSFTFPESDYVLIDALKLRALSQGMEFKKSEILRAGLTVLQSLSDTDLAKTLSAITRIKTGRPSKSK